MTGDGAVVLSDAARKFARERTVDCERCHARQPCWDEDCVTARAYIELANFSEGLECNVDALIQRCQEADATIRQQAAEIERLTLERDKFAFDRQQLWAALKAAEARPADLLKAERDIAVLKQVVVAQLLLWHGGECAPDMTAEHVADKIIALLGYRKRAAQVDREALMGVICLAMKEYVMEGPAGLARRIEQFILARS